MLCRSHFVVLGLRRHAHFPQLFINIFHERSDPLTDGSKIMIVKFLALRRHCAEEGASGIDQIFPLFKLLSIYKKVLLLRSYGRRSLFFDFVFPKSFSKRSACLLIASIERRSGVFWSSASPV